MKFLGAIIAGLALIAVLAIYTAHKNDAALRADCEARGGVFFHTRGDPVHVCAAVPPLRCTKTETGLVISPVLARGRDRLTAIPYTTCSEWEQHHERSEPLAKHPD
jgi:hypothetical protein